jgi:hypothetical protein
VQKPGNTKNQEGSYGYSLGGTHLFNLEIDRIVKDLEHKVLPVDIYSPPVIIKAIGQKIIIKDFRKIESKKT